jgi:hypothetical protein
MLPKLTENAKIMLKIEPLSVLQLNKDYFHFFAIASLMADAGVQLCIILALYFIINSFKVSLLKDQ